MSCDFCGGNFIAQKLGRCKQCMWLNLMLLVLATVLYLWLDVKQLQAVQRVALLMLLWSSAVLMSLHIIAWCYHYFKGQKVKG